MAKKKEGTRECGMMTISGEQGVGKTYLNMHTIKDYVKDKFQTKVAGRKCLIFDTNGEYTKEQFARNDIENFDPKRIALKDIIEWCHSSVVECRSIDAKNASIAEKKIAVEYIIKNLKNSMFVLEDINTYIINMTHMENIVSGLVNLRHKAVDVLISYQSLRAVEPRIWANSTWVRMHHQSDSVNDIKGKLNNPILFKISELIVNKRFLAGDKRFYVTIYVRSQKIEGEFTKLEFMDGCKKFLKEEASGNNISMDAALKTLCKQYESQYYGN